MSEAAAVLRPAVRGVPRAAVVTAVVCVAVALPLFFGETSTALQNMVLAAAYVIMALGLNVVVGFAGLLDLGYVAFFAIGAHVTAYFGSAFWGIHVNFLAILVLAAAATTIAGVLIGVPTLRLRGDYVGIVTLAFGEIIGQIVANGRDIAVFGGTLTGGPSGITAIDKIDLPFLERFSALNLRPWYWFALALVALMLLVTVRLRDSRLGRAWIALREDEGAAACLGVPIVRTKLLAYGVGAALGGVSGAFLATFLGAVNPHQFTFSFSIFILAMVVLGGLGSIWGVVVGAVILSVVNNYLLPTVLHDLPSTVGLDFDLAQVASGIYGFLLVIVMLLRPEGLLPERQRRTGSPA
jgi:branched-chain amino acid transport system permease protein